MTPQLSAHISVQISKLDDAITCMIESATKKRVLVNYETLAYLVNRRNDLIKLLK